MRIPADLETHSTPLKVAHRRSLPVVSAWLMGTAACCFTYTNISLVMTIPLSDTNKQKQNPESLCPDRLPQCVLSGSLITETHVQVLTLC